MRREESAADDAAFRLFDFAMRHREHLSPIDAAGLRELIPPARVVRSALHYLCGRRWTNAVLLAQQALYDVSSPARPRRLSSGVAPGAVPHLAEALGLSDRDTLALLRDGRTWRPCGKESALKVVASAEGVSPRTLRTGIARYLKHAARRRAGK